MTSGVANQRLRPFKPVVFGRYTLLMPISTGGMGEVFLARLEGPHGFDKLCVIKKILPHLAEDPEFVERFVNEARVLVKLSHGHIAQVLDMGLHDGSPYIALEYIDGKDLRRVIARMRDRNLPLPLSFVLYTMTRVLDALAYAHRKRGDDEKELNLVHRDVSPQNVLISYEGEVKVIDFGLAKSTLSNAKTNPSIVLGKFLYMSPEQARHQKVDRRSDLYAVGLCLYELIADKNPFDDVPPGELMAQVANPQLKPLSAAEPMCPEALSDIVMKALSPDPTLRFQNAEEFRSKLQAILLELDPNAGPETSSRFMRDCFATEYQAERKMLTALKEQAKQVFAGAQDPDNEVTAADELRRPTHDALTPVVDPLMATGPVPTLPEVPEPVPAPAPTPLAPPSPPARPAPEALSFAPTPKRSEPTKKQLRSEERDRETIPGTPEPERPERPARTDQPERASKESGAPSIVIDASADQPEDDAEPTEAAPRASKSSKQPRLERPEKSDKPDKSDKPSEAPPVSVKKTRPSAPRAEAKPAPKKKAAQNTPLKADPPPPEPSAPTPARARPPQRAQSMYMWVVIPVVALLAVAAYIMWDIYSENVKARALEETGGAREAPIVVPEGPPRRRAPAADPVTPPAAPDAPAAAPETPTPAEKAK